MKPMMTGLMFVSLATFGCARQTQTPNAATQVASSQGSSGGREGVLTSDQLLQSGARNVYEAIAKLRPECLRPRSSSTRSRQTDGSGPDNMASSSWRGLEISVYRDGMRSGKAEELRNIDVTAVETVECLTASDAAQRFGLNTTGGAIVLTSRRQ